MSFKVKDHYYHKAKKENYLARSIYKLQEIDEKYKIFNADQKILDLGYYPGSWTQYALEKISSKGKIVGVDIKEVNTKFNPGSNVQLFQQDIFEINSLDGFGVEEPFDVVMSDMAPNTTGIVSVDQIRSLNLVEHVFHLLPIVLKPEGDLVIKVFDGSEAQTFFREQRKTFEKIYFLKPKSTRKVSKEFFAIGKGYKGQ